MFVALLVAICALASSALASVPTYNADSPVLTNYYGIGASLSYRATRSCTGTAAASAGTMTCDFPTNANRITRLVALVGLSHSNAVPQLTAAGFLQCSAVVKNVGGTASFVTAISGSSDPMASGAPTAQGLDTDFISGGGTPSSCAFSISGTNARLTVTNQSTTSIPADVNVWIEGYEFGSQ